MLFKMEDRLQHNASHKIERWSDPSGGIFLCRIGPEEVNATPWHFEFGQGGGMASAFFSGMLHANPGQSHATSDEPAKRFLESGISSIRELRGFFAAAFHSATSTVIATDRRASIPIYYAQSNGILYFAPEPKALIDVPGLDLSLDLEAVASLLTSGHTLGHQCMVCSIHRLGGGQALTVGNGSVERKPYWEFRPGSKVTSASELELEEELGRLTEAAVIRNLGDPESTAIFLSGGADSRAILGGALAAVGGRGCELRTVTWGNDRGSERTDAGVAEMIAEKFQLQHDYLHRDIDQYSGDFAAVNYVLDGQCDLAALHPSEYRLMRRLRQAGFTRTLRGDQLFGKRHKVH
jgi:asparagine synthetase B (glutamine-hydrolysing)